VRRDEDCAWSPHRQTAPYERDGLLKSKLKNMAGRRRRLYKITAVGRKALKKAKTLVDELHNELHEEHPRRVSDLEFRRDERIKERVRLKVHLKPGRVDLSTCHASRKPR
jgi:DNA-binding PadR family transcriptional regulator